MGGIVKDELQKYQTILEMFGTREEKKDK